MYNFNRDAYQAEHERSEKMYTSASRHVPLHLRIDNGKRFAEWLSTNPIATAISGFASLKLGAVQDSEMIYSIY